VAQRGTTTYVAISTEIQRRIKKYYQRDAEIVFPPVDVDRFCPVSRPRDYYLIVSRLVPYKRIDLAVRAFTDLGLPLKIVGDGRDRGALEIEAGPNIDFLGWVPDSELPSLVSHCRAFIFPGREDFGLAPVEAQAAGRPVIAFRDGGALDTVIEGVTGTFFDEPTAESLRDAVSAFDPDSISPRACRSNAERFGFDRFRFRLAKIIEQLV
jgi:glycosyltransferase involved in cell wall biosynthesis